MTKYEVTTSRAAFGFDSGSGGSVYQFGWPARAFQQADFGGAFTRQFIGSIDAGPWMYPAHGGRLPISILPVGFGINTLFAAGVVLVIAKGLASARRILRSRAGRCPACSYDRRGLADAAQACPECGRVA